MKAIEIATRNHVTVDDVNNICQELNIPCAGEDSEIEGNDIFLVEKRIEIIKELRAKEARKILEKNAEKKDGKGKKIKLKRKVHVAKELMKDKAEEGPEESSTTEKTAESASSERKTEKRDLPTRDRKPVARTGGTGDRKSEGRDHPRRDQRDRPSRPPFDKKPVKEGGKPGGVGVDKAEAPKKDDSFASKDSLQKRKKSKDKDKDKDKKFQKGGRGKEVGGEKQIVIRKKKAPQRVERSGEVVTPKEIEITESIPVGDLAKKMNVKASEIIARLMKLGMMATINQVIDAETAEILASEYGTAVKVVSLYDETLIKHEEDDRFEDRALRPPVVTVMGHVDHGKTKLLDAIRKTNVVAGEFGGITQHIGAYMVNVHGQHVTFLDTPGHAAFTTMRARGAAVTDIVILVVAADDGVMPQTIEAINHAKAAGVPIIVAINKIDLQDANPDRVRQELANFELIPEAWGGSTLFAEISAKKGLNIEELLELILIQSEMLELKANPTLMAKGTVIESKLDPGRGAVATILVQNGSLRVGDPFVVGINSGKIRAMFDDQGQAVQEAGPSTPVEILGISGVPNAGDPFEVVESEKYSKQISQKRHELMRIESAKKVRKVTLEDLNEMIKEGEVQELRIIIKGDVDGSVQALKESLEKMSSGEVKVKVIHGAAGTINESDVMLASASNAIVIGYHVRPSSKVADLAEREKVSIKFYNIIYDATNDVKAAIEGMLSPEIKEVVTGGGEVRQIFKVSKVGTVAGSIVLNGKVERKNRIRLLRDGVVVFDGELKSLKRYKDDASEVDSGQECGFVLENYNDVKEGDTFESYKILKIAKSLD